MLTQMSLDEMAAKAFGLSSFTTVGHLLHINLRDHLIQHKHEIGQALLNNHPRALAVVNKLNSINNTYRYFDIEIIAKRPDCSMTDEELMICEVNQNKCRFKLDFSKVYWNSRLSSEHERIFAKLNKPHDFVFDLFAGVGPFSVPAAKSKCTVFANDLNPESIKWLRINMERNKVPKSNYEIFNKDAKDFILNDMKQKLVNIYQKVSEEEPAIMPKIHIIMNLPAIASTFLPYFISLLTEVAKSDEASSTSRKKNLLHDFREQSLEHIVYCYCFLKGVYDEPKKEVQSLIEESFGRKLTNDQLRDVFKVRNVAPFKDMYRVTIILDENILFCPRKLKAIMKKPSGVSLLASRPATNGLSDEEGDKGTKRQRQDSPSESNNSDVEPSKRARLSEYCSIM